MKGSSTSLLQLSKITVYNKAQSLLVETLLCWIVDLLAGQTGCVCVNITLQGIQKPALWWASLCVTAWCAATSGCFSTQHLQKVGTCQSYTVAKWPLLFSWRVKLKTIQAALQIHLFSFVATTFIWLSSPKMSQNRGTDTLSCLYQHVNTSLSLLHFVLLILLYRVTAAWRPGEKSGCIPGQGQP